MDWLCRSAGLAGLSDWLSQREMLACECERRACTLSIVLHFAFEVFKGKLQQVTVTFCMDSQDNDMHLT